MSVEAELEIRLLQEASKYSRWRWRGAMKRLQRRRGTPPSAFELHLAEVQILHTVWREMLRDAGRPVDTPTPAARRVSRRIATVKFREFLRDHPQ